VTVSTIQADWDEYTSCAIHSGRGNSQGWAWPGSWFPVVTGGNSFSLVSHTKSVLRNGAYHWRIDPDLVHANIVGAAYGLSIHEFDCDYRRNPRIYSREQAAMGPYLLVELADASSEPEPEPATELRLTHRGDPESLRLELRSPEHGFAYEVWVNGKPLPRWNIPFVQPGQVQRIPIRDMGLKDREQIEIRVVTLNRLGQRSRAVTIKGTVPAKRPVPLVEVEPLHRAGKLVEDMAIIPILDKYDAAGKPIGPLPPDYLTCNEVFDGKTIRLAAARGEVVGFQVLLKGSGTVQVRCNLDGLRTELWKAVYVQSDAGLIPDPLVRFERLELDRRRPTVVIVDVYVPFEWDKKQVRGQFVVSDGRVVPIELRVRNFAIPRKASFLCEMNTYGMPDKVSEFYELQQIAYDHRVHCNILHYSHRTAAPGARKCNLDMVMADGRRMDERRYNDIKPGATSAYWDDFIEVFGPYLSGECFRKGHRGPIAAPGFYLTFHESWPLNIRSYFNGNPDAFEAFKGSPEYSQTFVNILRDFITVAQQQRWTQAGFQLYLNNKGRIDDPSRNPWVLDEPASFLGLPSVGLLRGTGPKGQRRRLSDPASVPDRYLSTPVHSRPTRRQGRSLGSQHCSNAKICQIGARPG